MSVTPETRAELTGKPLVHIEGWRKKEWETWTGLVGYSLDHPLLGKTYVYTSPIVEEGDGWIETRNTVYQLGEPEANLADDAPPF